MIEKVLSSQRIFSGRVVNLEVAEVELADGSHQKREIIRHAGAAAVVPIDSDNRVILVRQFRSAAAQTMLEIPAGLLNPSEDPLLAAVRELREETGYKPTHIESLGGFYTAPGYTTEFIHLYLATGLVESPLPPDVDEFIEIERMSLDAALQLIDAEQITDAKTIIALLRVARRIPSTG